MTEMMQEVGCVQCGNVSSQPHQVEKFGDTLEYKTFYKCSKCGYRQSVTYYKSKVPVVEAAAVG
jgi:uncharacterized Zn finger protein